MKYILIFVLLFFISFELFAQDYPAEILNYDIECIINENEKLIVKKRLLLKITSPLGREHADIKIYYDNKSTIQSIKANILNKHQVLIKTFRKKEISDYSLLTGYFHTDDRYKEIKAYHNEYPYIIELEYIKEYDEFFSFPTWYPQNGENIPVKKSSYKLTVPDDYSFHYKFYNFEPKEDIQTNESLKTYSWQTENLSPIFVQEAFMPPLYSIYPTAQFVPDNFKFGSIKGNSKTWQDIGIWQSKLIEGLDNLPETEIQRIKELTKNTTVAYEKVKIIYEYLQNETRYVGVFIGIGGWKPFDATSVCVNKYGDCKALTNYMMAMLKAIGIQSYYSLIVAGENEMDIDTSFPGMGFNHTVLYVPLEKDTLWLECTSQDIPFNYWGTFTNGKHALVCDYKNSFITQTPQFNFHENSVNQISQVYLIDGKLIVDMKRELFGETYEDVNNNLASNPEKNLIDIASRTISFKNCKINNITYEDIYKYGTIGYKESLELTFLHYAQQYGSNLIISPFNDYVKTKYPLNAERQNPISILHNFTFTDTLQFNIPDGYELDVIPDDFQIATKFGVGEIRYAQQTNQLIISKLIIFNKGLYPLTDYHQFKSFITSIISKENQKLLLRKL
jgi:hypothetical protein